MKKVLFLLPLFVYLPSCSKTTATITAKYMKVSENLQLVESEIDFKCYYTYEAGYVFTQAEIDKITGRAFRRTEYYVFSRKTVGKVEYYCDFYFDKEMKNKLEEGYKLIGDVTLYYCYENSK